MDRDETSKDISATLVKELREKTGAGIMECKRALAEAKGEMGKATTILRERGVAVAAKKADRVAREGMVTSYIHGGGRMGVLIEVNCETDFVARNQEFLDLVKDLAMQVASTNPTYVQREDVPPDILKSEGDVFRVQARQSGKPEAVIEKIVDGKMVKFFQEMCLLEQSFVKDSSLTIQELIKQKIAKTGENIVVRRFVRYLLGEKS